MCVLVAVVSVDVGRVDSGTLMSTVMIDADGTTIDDPILFVDATTTNNILNAYRLQSVNKQ